MGKIEKLIERFVEIPADFTWDELVRLLRHFGYDEIKGGKTGGSRRKFADANGHMISLHKPHPGNIVKKYALRYILQTLQENHKMQ